jgi:UDP-4-amino-4,6-dideoxy-N-acetyl-beta-L-altrosamine transaminase
MVRKGPEMIPYGLQDIDEEDIQEVENVLRSGWITTGPKIPEFERALSDYIQCDHTVVVNSGTSALDIAVGSLNLKKGAEVITTPFSFVATSNALLYNGLKPVFADIEQDTRNIDPDNIRAKITKNTRAIAFVDFAGHPCRMKEIVEIADENDLVLIGDACHALGAEYQGKKIGTFADVTAFSFHPVKHITTGEGGAVTTNRPELYKKMLMLRNHGIDRDAWSRFGPEASWAYDMKFLGRNYRMTDFQAALGISQLKKLDLFVKKRTALAERYRNALRDIPWITLPCTLPGVKHAWHIFTVLLEKPVDRDAFFKYMRAAGIGVNVHYIPIYRHSYYLRNYPALPKDYPVTEDVFSRIVTLPLHPGITGREFDYIVDTIVSYKGSD